jgi:hypothetical protein
MKIYFKFIFLFLLLSSFKAYSHTENLGIAGVHMSYSPSNYHCHQKNKMNSEIKQFYINHQGQTYGPYSSYSSCMQMLEELWS